MLLTLLAMVWLGVRLVFYLWAMRTRIPYKNIKHTVSMMQRQISESLDYAAGFVPRDTDPKELFWILRQNTVYKNDPPGVELLQSMHSLFEDNYWGIPGAGDCDCFTITATACAVVSEIPTRIILVGNSPSAPSHVYNEVLDRNKWRPFDLVNEYYEQTRPYKYKKVIQVF